MGLEVIRVLELLAQDLMIVYLAIHCQRQRAVFVDKRLGPRVFDILAQVVFEGSIKHTNANNTQSLVGKDFSEWLVYLAILMAVVKLTCILCEEVST